MCDKEPIGMGNASAGGEPNDAGGRKTTRSWSKRVGKIDFELSPEDLATYQSMENDPQVTNQALRRWLVERGYRIGQYAVAGRRRGLTEALRQMKAAAGTFAAMSKMFGNGRRASLAHLAQARLEHLLVEKLYAIDPSGELRVPDLEELESVAAIMSKTAASRARLDGTFYRWERDLAAKLAGKEATFRDVSDRVRALLGIPTDDEDDDDPNGTTDAGPTDDSGPPAGGGSPVIDPKSPVIGPTMTTHHRHDHR